jgi:hypothetical protein
MSTADHATTCESAQTQLSHSALYESTTGAHKTAEWEIL